MGLFKSIKKAFKKVTSGIKKVVKGVVKGVKKVVKKISSSKILKALAIAAAVVVTGGAAIAAFTGGAGVTAGTFGANFANWMMGTSQAVTGGTLFGSAASKSFIPRVLTQTGNFAAKTLASPFKAIGTAAGTAAGAVTDFTGLTTEASRAGVTPAMETAMAEAQIAAGVSNTTGPTTLLSQEQAANAAAKAAGASEGTMAYLQQRSAETAASYGISSAEITAAGLPTPTAKTQGTAGRIAEGVATGTATAVLSGAALQAIQGDPEETGSMGGLRTEGASSFDPLRVYAAERGIADADISKYFTFGNTAEAGNMPLFQQQTIGVA